MKGRCAPLRKAKGRKIAALFCRSDSVYRSIDGISVWDESRDARLFLGNGPVIAHPPCRGWGRLRHMAKVRPDELDLGRFAVWTVRAVGGVLEHPEASSLWADMGLPRPGQAADEFGGWTMSLDQSDFGHPSRKRTWLYIVGIGPRDLPPFQVGFTGPVVSVEKLGKAAREKTPPDFAKWLVDLASRANVARGGRGGDEKKPAMRGAGRAGGLEAGRGRG